MMDHREVGRFWNENAETWTHLARLGYDVYRDFLNTPAFFEMLPPITGLTGLDLGCGEGHNTRLLARRGAKVTAIDIAEVFLRYAMEEEKRERLGIEYVLGSAVELPFADESFDFAVGFMSLMDIPEVEEVLAEAIRVLKPNGFLQFSIEHPCFATPHRRKVRDDQGRTLAVEVGGYFSDRDGEIEEWLFGSAPMKLRQSLPKFRIPRFRKSLSEWLNLVLKSGFVLEAFQEPYPDERVIEECPKLQDAQIVAYFLHIRARKP